MNVSIKRRLYHQTPLKILSFLSLHPGETFSAQEVSMQTRSSKGATNQALRLLLDLDILSRERKGNVFLYRLRTGSGLLRQFKIFEVLLGLQTLVRELKPHCYQIVLFGSCAEGTHAQESDIDLFIKAEHKRKVRRIVSEHRIPGMEIQAIVQDPLEVADARQEDREFFRQVKKGIVLWEGRPVDE